MTIQSPYALPGVNSFGVVQNVNANQVNDVTPLAFAFGRHNDALMSTVHGDRYQKASRGNMFWGTSGTSGASLIAPGQTTGSFILFNPANSGVLVEVEKFSIVGASTETAVIAGLALEGSVQTPTGTLTGATVSQMPLGSGNVGSTTAASAAKARVYEKATITAMTFLGGLGLTITATTSPMPVGIVDFDGSLVLYPGMCINVVSTITQSTDIAVCDWFWSEWPI